MATGRRWVGVKPKVIGIPPEDYARPLQAFIDRVWDSESEGIPAGFTDTDPETLAAGSTPDPGTEGTGWAAADHAHPLLTAPASGADPDAASSEGSGSAVARADHGHSMALVMADVLSKISLGF